MAFLSNAYKIFKIEGMSALGFPLCPELVEIVELLSKREAFKIY